MFSKETNWDQLFKKSSIGRHFALYILVFSSVVTLLSTALQLGIEYKKDMSEITARLDEIRDGYSQSLVNALWTTSQENIQMQLHGIIKLPDMQYIEVRSDQNKVIAFSGIKPTNNHILSEEYPLIYKHHSGMITLGSLHVVSTLDGVYARLQSKIIVILITQGVKTFIVSLFILYLFQLLVGRHLAAIANFTRLSKDLNVEDRLALDRIKTSSSINDELDIVVNSINNTRSNLRESFFEIQKSEENLSITLHSIGDGVIATDKEGLVTRMNPVAEHLTGWTLADALGRPMKEIFNIINAQTRLPVINPVELVMEHGNVVGLANHTVLLSRDGHEYQIADSAAPIRNSADEIVGVVLVFHNVTEQYNAEARISRLSQVVDQSPLSIIITDADGVIEYVNTRCQTMSGYLEEELIGKKMSVFCSGVHHKAFYKELWNTISVQKKMWRGTIINKMRNNQNIDCSSTIFPLFDADNKVVHFVTIQEDTTEKNIKENLFTMQTRQAQMGEMLSMIAHQWRQPLTVISALINKQRMDIVLEKYTLDGIMESMDDVDKQVQYLSQTITDFKDFFKPDKEKTTTRNSLLFEKTLGLIGTAVKKQNIEFLTQYDYDEPFDTYEHEMVQVIMNLIKNAQDVFSERHIKDPMIKVMTYEKEGMNIITVEDNGGGVDNIVMDTLFLPYISTKSHQNGTGLGLYMSKTIVEEHCAGKLSVDNTANGAKFTISLPIKESHGTF